METLVHRRHGNSNMQNHCSIELSYKTTVSRNLYKTMVYRILMPYAVMFPCVARKSKFKHTSATKQSIRNPNTSRKTSKPPSTISLTEQFITSVTMNKCIATLNQVGMHVLPMAMLLTSINLAIDQVLEHAFLSQCFHARTSRPIRHHP